MVGERVLLLTQGPEEEKFGRVVEEIVKHPDGLQDKQHIY
jgi:hypothetical protein